MAVISWSDTKTWHSSSSIFEEIMNFIHKDQMSTSLRDALSPFREYYYLDLIELSGNEILELIFLIKNIKNAESSHVFTQKINELIVLIES